MGQINFLKSKAGGGLIAIVSIAAGIIFLNKGITGNAVYQSAYTGSFISGIGALLIICAAVLAIYALFRR